MPELPPALAAIDATGSIPASQLTAGLARAVAPLLAGGVLVRERSGAGERVVLHHPDRWKQWLASTYPASQGIAVAAANLVRSGAIAERRDSKISGKAIHATPLLLRSAAGREVTIAVNGHPLSVSSLCAVTGCASVLLADATQLGLPESVALIENLESFLHFEDILPAVPLALLSSGRPSERLIACLDHSLIVPGQLLHLPDYDPIGLDDFLRLHAVLDRRVRLHVPPDLKERFHRLSKRSLIQDKPRNQDLLISLANTVWPLPEAAEVFNLIRSHGAGLEQEALWIQMGT